MKPTFVIQTRQKDDIIYRLAATDIAAAASATLPVRKVIGYGVIRFLAFSDDTLVLRVEQGPTKTGPFVETDRLPSVPSPSGSGQQMVCGAVSPCAPFMRAFLDNTGPGTEEVELIGSGHPVAGGGAGGGGSTPASIVKLQDGDSTKLASIKADGAAITANDGGQMMSGRAPGAIQKDIAVNAAGQLIISVGPSTPGTTITSSANTVIGSGATVPLAAPPVGTTQMTVQNKGPAGTLILIREVGGAAGTGFILVRFSSKTFGGEAGAIAALEAEDIAALATTAMIQFEGP